MKVFAALSAIFWLASCWFLSKNFVRFIDRPWAVILFLGLFAAAGLFVSSVLVLATLFKH
jgi:hypothetical protein